MPLPEAVELPGTSRPARGTPVMQADDSAWEDARAAASRTLGALILRRRRRRKGVANGHARRKSRRWSPGAGRGIGRGIALLLAREGAGVVVNDLGASLDGAGEDTGPAATSADEIEATGGTAVANTDSVTDYQAAEGDDPAGRSRSSAGSTSSSTSPASCATGWSST